jgi:aminobenzoyl-glutamate transport protein
MPDAPPPASERPRRGLRLLEWVERTGNRLPDPVTLFAGGAIAVLAISALVAGWSVEHPLDASRTIEVKSLLDREGLRWVFTSMVRNFTEFHPLGVVLVAMLGIGVAERTGLIAVVLRGVVAVTPRGLVTPSLVFVGVLSSLAADAGYVVLPPLAAAIFARMHRAPLAGMAAVFVGVAGGFSANLVVTSLDPLLQGLTQEAATLLDPEAVVRVDANWWFMAASTVLITLVGWAVTAKVVEPRFSREEIDAQIAAGLAASGGTDSGERITAEERRGLWMALAAMLVTGAALAALILVPGAPLHGAYEAAPGRLMPIWADVMVPLLFLLFLVPGIAYGLGAGAIRSDRDVARLLGLSMSAMGTYIVLSFFAGQFVAYFRESNLGTLVAVTGVDWLQSLAMPPLLLLVGVVLLTAVLNLFLGSASAKWALLAPVFVPLFMGVGIAPELTQAAYRVGDSCTNAIAPLNPYLVVILVYLRQYQPKGGLGSLVSLMLPYTVTLLVLWTLFLVAWAALGIPLGPGEPRLFIPPLGAAGG